MLGRHGNNLFWMARYLERCENTARIIQATLNYSLSREDEGKDEWLSIIYNSGYEKVFFEKYGFKLDDRYEPENLHQHSFNRRSAANIKDRNYIFTKN